MVKIIDNTGIIILERSQMKCREGIRRGLMKSMTQVKRDAIYSIVYPVKTGRLYNIGGIKHQASAPGEPPANLTGELINSIGTRMQGSNEMVLEATAPHAEWLEIGTKDGRIKPRPFISRTGKKMTREVEQNILDEVSKEMSHK